MATQTGKTKLLLFTLPISSLLLLIFLIKSPSQKTHYHHKLDATSHIESNTYNIAANHCKDTPYPDLCVSTLTSVPQLTTKSLPQIISSTINRTASTIKSSAGQCASLLRSLQLTSYDIRQRVALTDCLDLFDQTMSDFYQAVADLKKHPRSRVDGVKTVLSAAMTNQYTCLDGFAYVNDSLSLRPMIEGRLFKISRLVSNALAMAKKLPVDKETRTNQEYEEYREVQKRFPEWISERDQQLLTENTIVPDFIVAKDGSGNFMTIMEAVNMTRSKSMERTVIYIKAGVYFENVEVVKKKTNLMFIGDGIGKTVIKASRNVLDGYTTYKSATVAVVGSGFIARNLTIENAAGPHKHQAVALRSNSDLSAFYRCSFVGYQDTLYVHSMRQFYRECDVYGTVDFIFGDATVVFQYCNLYARKPSAKQNNVFTAQGRKDPNQNTGIVLQNCKIAAAADLVPVQSKFKTFLGRPWMLYSRTLILNSYIDSLIDPAGWLEWDGDFALNTSDYGEYMNRGPGSNTTARVQWPGYRVINSSADALQFTVGPFIQGDEWLPSTMIPFATGLIERN